DRRTCPATKGEKHGTAEGHERCGPSQRPGLGLTAAWQNGVTKVGGPRIHPNGPAKHRVAADASTGSSFIADKGTIALPDNHYLTRTTGSPTPARPIRGAGAGEPARSSRLGKTHDFV